MAQPSKQTKATKERRRPVAPAPKPDQQPDQQPHREPEREAGPPGEGSHVCDVAFCPIGMALTAAERVQPEVVSHLLIAGREFFLAAKAVMDARAEDLERDGATEGRGRMERIDIG